MPYLPLPDDIIRRIMEMPLRKIARRVKDSYRDGFPYAVDAG